MPWTTRGGSLSLGTERREQDHVADVRGAREVHEETIDADAHAAHRRHAVFHRAEIILVYPTGLEIARREQPGLGLEPLALVDRVVELTEGIRHLLAARKQLEAFRQPRHAALRLGQ